MSGLFVPIILDSWEQPLDERGHCSAGEDREYSSCVMTEVVEQDGVSRGLHRVWNDLTDDVGVNTFFPGGEKRFPDCLNFSFAVKEGGEGGL